VSEISGFQKFGYENINYISPCLSACKESGITDCIFTSFIIGGFSPAFIDILQIYEISGFRHGVNEICVLFGLYAV
jgi:hypothetical protein